jgi:hypothetical protein
VAVRTTRTGRFSADRGRFCLFFSTIASIWTLILVDRVESGLVDWIDIAAWGSWLVVTMVWTFGTPGWMKWSKRERSIINDELARDHQRSAALLSMVVLMSGMALGSVFVLGLADLPNWWPVAALGSGVAVSGIRFGWLQTRS